MTIFDGLLICIDCHFLLSVGWFTKDDFLHAIVGIGIIVIFLKNPPLFISLWNISSILDSSIDKKLAILKIYFIHVSVVTEHLSRRLGGLDKPMTISSLVVVGMVFHQLLTIQLALPFSSIFAVDIVSEK